MPVSMVQVAIAGEEPVDLVPVPEAQALVPLRSAPVSTFFWVLVPVWNSMPCPPEMDSLVLASNVRLAPLTVAMSTPPLDWSLASGWIEAEMVTRSLGVSPFW